jgi:hypothetical protein
MFVPLLVLPLAVQLIAATDAMPTLNVTPSCKGAAAAYTVSTDNRLQMCIDSEHRARDQLAKDWTTFPADARTFCLSSIASFEPTYTELATCLEMRRDLAAAKSGNSVPAPSKRRPSPVTTGQGSN